VSFLGEQSLTRRRFAAGVWTAGLWVEGAAVDSTFLGSVQPLKGKDRQVLEEGVRQRDGRKVYCDRGTLLTADQHSGTSADHVLIGSLEFVVMHVDDSHPLLPHDRAFLVRLQEAGP